MSNELDNYSLLFLTNVFSAAGTMYSCMDAFSRPLTVWGCTFGLVGSATSIALSILVGTDILLGDEANGLYSFDNSTSLFYSSMNSQYCPVTAYLKQIEEEQDAFRIASWMDNPQEWWSDLKNGMKLINGSLDKRVREIAGSNRKCLTYNVNKLLPANYNLMQYEVCTSRAGLKYLQDAELKRQGKKMLAQVKKLLKEKDITPKRTLINRGYTRFFGDKAVEFTERLVEMAQAFHEKRELELSLDNSENEFLFSIKLFKDV
ncbi:uncharacterized protein KNAG_0C05080 [Huiozyma naganishii CBS 8797]|uniref:Uncharacterized protein n=1 Tax=Huiozyma naganishii (strain ATCC MYA-139 / BCRC 22969 / CBS 8797 / KCTC 17520 / NBRC 10181 / NCYC 3082 / Yp74L-3) TaxID=1071383 RepID=J7S516_HUIN7|nr:hypothetical protein KNAG_0C05080 [Kazachstania naganishii CBS 8797]CCK69609.1 hypothetical protein KNAG_0C05080 [Kazachstania naganishii CBS 8797]